MARGCPPQWWRYANRGTLCRLRSGAMLLLGFAGGLRRSEFVELDVGRDQAEHGRGWAEILSTGISVTGRGTDAWREIEFARGGGDAGYPAVHIESWLKLMRIASGPLLQQLSGHGREVEHDRPKDHEVTALVNRTAHPAGVRGDLIDGERQEKFATRWPATPRYGSESAR